MRWAHYGSHTIGRLFPPTSIFAAGHQNANSGDNSGRNSEESPATAMEDSASILCQISSSKVLLDQVNEEIEESIQTTREIESEIVICLDLEKKFLLKESELTKIVSAKEFELMNFMQVTASGQKSLETIKIELGLLSAKREELLKRIANSRETFLEQCEFFQNDIVSGESTEMKSLLLEKDMLAKEKYDLKTKLCVLNNSTSAFVEEVLEELNCTNSVLQVQIRHGNRENDRLAKSIDDLKCTLLALGSCYEQ